MSKSDDVYEFIDVIEQLIEAKIIASVDPRFLSNVAEARRLLVGLLMREEDGD